VKLTNHLYLEHRLRMSGAICYSLHTSSRLGDCQLYFYLFTLGIYYTGLIQVRKSQYYGISASDAVYFGMYIPSIWGKPLSLLSSQLSLLSSQQASSLRPLACCDRGFESHRGQGYLSVVSVVCCQVKVSATS